MKTYSITLISLKKKHDAHSYAIKYQEKKYVYELGYKSQTIQYSFSSRAHIDQISNNLVVIFTVPIINLLDSLNISQNNIYMKYIKKMQDSSFGFMINYSHNNLHYYHRASTPPFNPIIPIVRSSTGDYDSKMLNVNLSYLKKMNKLGFQINWDNMIPLSATNNFNKNDETRLDDLSFPLRFLILNKIDITISYLIN